MKVYKASKNLQSNYGIHPIKIIFSDNRLLFVYDLSDGFVTIKFRDNYKSSVLEVSLIINTSIVVKEYSKELRKIIEKFIFGSKEITVN